MNVTEHFKYQIVWFCTHTAEQNTEAIDACMQGEEKEHSDIEMWSHLSHYLCEGVDFRRLLEIALQLYFIDCVKIL